MKKTDKPLTDKKYRIFKGYPQKDRKTTHIDEYLGTHIVQKTPELLTKILDKTKTGKAVLLTKTHAIDAENPTDCYAAYAKEVVLNTMQR